MKFPKDPGGLVDHSRFADGKTEAQRDSSHSTPFRNARATSRVKVTSPFPVPHKQVVTLSLPTEDKEETLKFRVQLAC